MEIITVDPQKCIACNACVRICPVPEACVPKKTPEGKLYTGIDPNKCINCGECIKKCPHEARDFEDDHEDFIEDMYSKKGKVSLLVDPSVRVAFPDVWQDVLKWFYIQGIRKIYDVSFGADIATWAQISVMNLKKIDKYITSSCAAAVSYAEKYDNSLIEKLSPVHSPAACMAIYAKNKLGDKADFAYLGPCPARKEEFNDIGIIKYNVTFKRMKAFFEKRKVQFSNTGQGFNFEFTYKQGMMGALYPKPKGIKENILIYRPDLNVSNCDGPSKTFYQLENYNLQAKEYLPDVLEVLSCEDGCNAGIGMGNETPHLGTISRIMDITRKDAEKRRSGLFMNRSDRLYKEFDKELDLQMFCRKYIPKNRVAQIPSEMDINNIFNSMLKKTQEDRTVNCQSCGHKTCRDMAIAIFRGASYRENCIDYLRRMPANDNAQVSEIKNSLMEMNRMIHDNIPLLSNDVAAIRKEAVSIFSNNSKTAEAAKTINSVIEQMIDACSNPKGVSRETISEISSTLDLIRKILLNLSKFVTKNSESGYSIDKCVTSIETISQKISEASENIARNQLKN